MKDINKKWLFILQIALLIYSCSGLFSKSASKFQFFSIPFIVCYGGMLFILVVYAVMWQQVIKHLPLTLAFANKAITVVWGMILGALFFKETFSMKQIIGAGIIIIGVILYMMADKEKADV